eukprot:SAG31_NODE_41584_length_275_cov_0.875000_1_plen_33_part_01
MQEKTPFPVKLDESTWFMGELLAHTVTARSLAI